MQQINRRVFGILIAGDPGRRCDVAHQARSVHVHVGSLRGDNEVRREADPGRQGLRGRHSRRADESRARAEDRIQTQRQL